MEKGNEPSRAENLSAQATDSSLFINNLMDHFISHLVMHLLTACLTVCVFLFVIYFHGIVSWGSSEGCGLSNGSGVYKCQTLPRMDQINYDYIYFIINEICKCQ